MLLFAGLSPPVNFLSPLFFEVAWQGAKISTIGPASL